MKVIDPDGDITAVITIDEDYAPVKITGDLAPWVESYLSRSYGYGGHFLDISSTTMFDVFVALSNHPEWILAEVPILKRPDIPEGSVS